MSKNSINYSLGPLEREILKIAWQSKKVCVRHVLEQLSNDLNPAYTTVMTVMNRMVDKGILKREKPNNTCYYQTTQTKDTFLSSLVEENFDQFINHYGPEVIPILKQGTNHLS
ncbi:MAG: BlaI/MecI/CopY family transcriptional regulator [Candidatus Pacebacteria bacterium]|nr:BlaI/MecI/CopY family transcriptional regulator [Candidatus Paceibacterota bacterium]